jgi:adenylylsulfate kinase
VSLVVLFTGLSGAGKTTLCQATQQQLLKKGIAATILDGDAFRERYCQDLGFSQQDRRENLRRMSREADRLSRRGSVVLLAAISQYRDIRAEIRAHHHAFIEVFVNAPLHVCESRDPKGLYKRARAGLIEDFTGVSSPYEEPL